MDEHTSSSPTYACLAWCVRVLCAACRYSPALAPAAAPDGGSLPPAQQPAPPLLLSAAEDPHTQLALDLFPEHIRSEIMAVLAEEEEKAAASAGEAQGRGIDSTSSSSELAAAEELEAGGDGIPAGGGDDGGGSGASAQLVEVIVDCNRPVRVRLSNRREVQLQQEFAVEVRLGAAPE